MSKDIVDIKAALKLKGFSFRISSRVKGMKAGIHKSQHKGISPDFLEYKEYSHGDELKHVDWRLYGRFDRLYVKKFEDEVNLSWCILIDRSGSMGYASSENSKLHYSLKLSGTLAYLLLKQGDAVGIGDFSKNDLNLITPRSGMINLTHIAEKLSSFSAYGKTELKEAVLKAIGKTKRDSAFVIVSDFLMDLDPIEESIKLLRAAGREVIALQVLDPDEIEFNFDGSIEFVDIEEGTRILVDAGDIKNTYRKRMKEFIQRLKSICLQHKSRYVFSPTTIPIEDVLIQIAEK
jgi:uncharacterized protein (DUF58 family)